LAQVSVQFDKVTYRIGEKALVSGLSFEVEPGEMLVLLGRSGSGKTTTLRMINGLLFAQQGEVSVGGTSTTQWDPIELRKGIGYVIQEVGLFPHLSVERNVGMAPFLSGWDVDSVKARTHELLDQLGLPPKEFASRYPDELSGGQRQRVGIARALAADPPLLLMDEPFSALDALTRLQIQREFRALQNELGKTVVMVTHDVQEALFLATKVGLMSEGRLVELVDPAGFLNSKKPEARAFVEGLGRISMT
jgi:osmoprotectant transport system ATP-binding protein